MVFKTLMVLKSPGKAKSHENSRKILENSQKICKNFRKNSELTENIWKTPKNSQKIREMLGKLEIFENS